MIVTVTPNPAVDRTVSVRGFSIGTTNRAVAERIDIGGKGINVARHLAGLGCDVVATGFLDAGDGHRVLQMLAVQGIQTDFVRVAGNTRMCLKILDPANGQETEINESGPLLAPEAVPALFETLRALAPRCAVMVFSGSLPPGAPADLYARAIEVAAAAGARTILDAAGDALRYGIAAKPDLVKPNRAEAEELLGVPLGNDAELLAGAKRLVEYGAGTAVISLGPDGAVCASGAGVWRARAPRITARNTVGAGDAMVAALACAVMRSLTTPEALRLATALGSATAASHEPVPAKGCLDALLGEVIVEALAPGETPDVVVRSGC
jgi:1-phosphofructokinase family hexose kinase